jgi:CheY-like chemotaxis protein
MAKVLLVEDTEQMQRMYSFGLVQEGFEVVIAASASAALAKMEEQPYDVILLDMMLSGMSGLDFLETGQITTKYPGSKIVVLSNVDNPNIIERAKAQGVTDYLIKAQYEPAQLAAYLKNMLASQPVVGPVSEAPAE